jgi:hypothetical protein
MSYFELLYDFLVVSPMTLSETLELHKYLRPEEFSEAHVKLIAQSLRNPVVIGR